jgi:DNA polymerase-3 subunit epsilon
LANALHTLHSDIARHLPSRYVGHNVSFDRPIVLNEYRRIRHPENISSLPTFCTMKTGTNVCRLPSNRGGYKWPKLEELHRHLFGHSHASAHDAKGDVCATAKCFFELRRRGHA